MKKLLLTTLCLVVALSTAAQKGEIIYTDFVPDLHKGSYTSDTLFIDADGNGTNDIALFYSCTSVGPYYYIDVFDNWSLCVAEDPNDTISDSCLWMDSDHNSFIWLYDDIGQIDKNFGLRKLEDNNAYYGWFVAYWRNSGDYGYMANVYFDKMALCNIPNYPLRFGQTSIDLSVNEVDASPLLSVSPNPTENSVCVKLNDNGNNSICDIRIFDISGRFIKSQTAGFESVDISSLAPGIYVMKVTLADGRAFEEKIVKE